MSRPYSQLDLDRQLCFALYSASRAVTRAYGPLLEEFELTYPQYVTLLALWDTAGVPMTVGELGARLHLDSGTLTPLLKRLEGLGYVRRSRDREDERRVFIEVTDEGWRLRQRVSGIPGRLLRRVGLDLDEVRSLRNQLTSLVDHLEATAPV